MAIFASTLSARSKGGKSVQSVTAYHIDCKNKTDAYLRANECALKEFPPPEWTDQQAVVMEIAPEHIAEEARKLGG